MGLLGDLSDDVELCVIHEPTTRTDDNTYITFSIHNWAAVCFISPNDAHFLAPCRSCLLWRSMKTFSRFNLLVQKLVLLKNSSPNWWILTESLKFTSRKAFQPRKVGSKSIRLTKYFQAAEGGLTTILSTEVSVLFRKIDFKSNIHSTFNWNRVTLVSSATILEYYKRSHLSWYSSGYESSSALIKWHFKANLSAMQHLSNTKRTFELLTIPFSQAAFLYLPLLFELHILHTILTWILYSFMYTMEKSKIWIV